MILTREFVDTFAPRHERTSCSDDNLENRFGGWDGHYEPGTGRKSIRYPRCNRCYLLDHVGDETDNMEFEIEVRLFLKEK